VKGGQRVLLGLLFLALTGDALARALDAHSRHLILVCLDGLRPEIYLDDAYPAPELRARLGAGSHARAAESVFPTVTYPSHASIVTGVRPARHGISFNVLFGPSGERGRWYEEAADLRSAPLWEWARAAVVVTGDHGFRDVRRVLFPNQLLADAAARLLGIPAPPVEGRVLEEILR
jgi:hypothetical protein